MLENSAKCEGIKAGGKTQRGAETTALAKGARQVPAGGQRDSEGGVGPPGGGTGDVKGRPAHVSPLSGTAQGLVHQGQSPDCLQGLESCTLRENPAGPGRGGGGPLG